MDETNSNEYIRMSKTVSVRKKSELSEKSMINSFRVSVAKVSDFYEQTSKVISKMGDLVNSQEEENINFDKNVSKGQLDDKRISRTHKREEGSLGFLATLFIYIKVNIVAGFLFLPNGFNLGGWLFSILAIIFVSVIVAYCNISLAECTDEVNSYSFSVIAFRSLGSFGKYLVDYGIAISQVRLYCKIDLFSLQLCQFNNNSVREIN